MTLGFLKALAVIVLFTLSGCGLVSRQDGEVVNIPEFGLSMRAPAGWHVDRNDSRMFWKGDSTGIIIDEPLVEENFRDKVWQLSNAHGGMVFFSNPLQVNGFEAVSVFLEYPHAGTRAVKVYINRDQTLIEISYVTPVEDYDLHEKVIRDSINSIRIE